MTACGTFDSYHEIIKQTLFKIYNKSILEVYFTIVSRKCHVFLPRVGRAWVLGL